MYIGFTFFRTHCTLKEKKGFYILYRPQQIQNCLARAVLKPLNSLTPLIFLKLYTGSKSVSILSIKFFLLHIKFLLLLNLAISEI